jgi:hypothetical protein
MINYLSFAYAYGTVTPSIIDNGWLSPYICKCITPLWKKWRSPSSQHVAEFMLQRKCRTRVLSNYIVLNISCLTYEPRASTACTLCEWTNYFYFFGCKNTGFNGKEGRYQTAENIWEPITPQRSIYRPFPFTKPKTLNRIHSRIWSHRKHAVYWLRKSSWLVIREWIELRG